MAATIEAGQSYPVDATIAVAEVEEHEQVYGVAAKAAIIAAYEGDLSQGQRAWLDDKFNRAHEAIANHGLHPSSQMMAVRSATVKPTDPAEWEWEIRTFETRLAAAQGKPFQGGTPTEWELRALFRGRWWL